MQNYQEIVHRLRLDQSIRQISKDTGTHRTIIRNIKKLAQKNHWLDPLDSVPNLATIQEKLNNEKATAPASHQLEHFSNDIKQWLKNGYSHTVIHHLIKDRVACSLSTISRFIHRNFPRSVDPVMVRSTEPGAIADVDFGYFGIVYDESCAQNRKAWFFSCRLRHSRKTYREVVLNQFERTFFTAHIHAFEFFQGVPMKIVLDNLKAGVIEASITEPLLNSSYRELAHHYGFMISPCAPYTPEHKGGVENDVKYVKKNFWPIFLENQKQKGRTIPSLIDLKEGLIHWNHEIAEQRKIAGIHKNVIEIFEQEEKEKLRKLPLERWDPIEWKKTKVGPDWRISFDSSHYTVPFQLIGQEVMVCASSLIVRIFYEHIEVTQHFRAEKKGEYKRKVEHAPPQLDEVMNATRDSLIIRAEKFGGYILIVVMHLLTDPVQDQLNAARHVLNLEKKYDQLRLEAACYRAVMYSTISYKSIRLILEGELEKQPIGEEMKQQGDEEVYRFARSIEHYDI